MNNNKCMIITVAATECRTSCFGCIISPGKVSCYLSREGVTGLLTEVRKFEVAHRK